MTEFGVKETLCTRCMHRPVCIHKDIYLCATEAVDNVTVSLPSNGAEKCTIELRNIPWIKPVELSCVNYICKEAQHD